MNLLKKIRYRLFPPKINKMIFNYQVACAKNNLNRIILCRVTYHKLLHNKLDIYIKMLIKNIDNPKNKLYVKGNRKVPFK